jgi:mannosyltransferase OCH1-like enzyme
MITMTGMGQKKDIFISILDSSNAGIHNGLMIVTPKHPFMKQYINDIILNVSIGKEEEIFSLTGPLCLSRAINKVQKNSINSSHRIGLNKGIYNYYLFEHHNDMYQSITDKNKKLLYKKYDYLHCMVYQKGLNFTKHNYTYMYHTGQKIVKD